MNISLDVAIAAGIYERLSKTSKLAAMDYLMYLRDLETRLKDEKSTQAYEQYAAMLDDTAEKETADKKPIDKKSVDLA